MRRKMLQQNSIYLPNSALSTMCIKKMCWNCARHSRNDVGDRQSSKSNGYTSAKCDFMTWNGQIEQMIFYCRKKIVSEWNGGLICSATHLYGHIVDSFCRWFVIFFIWILKSIFKSGIRNSIEMIGLSSVHKAKYTHEIDHEHKYGLSFHCKMFAYQFCPFVVTPIVCLLICFLYVCVFVGWLFSSFFFFLAWIQYVYISNNYNNR